MIHDVKLAQPWFDRVEACEKRAEIRAHDRDYQVDDILHMTEVNAFGSPVTYPVDSDTPEGADRGHRTIDVRVLHVLDGRQALGIDDNYCLLSFVVISGRDPR